MQHTEGEAGGLRLKCDGTRAETRFRLSAKRTSLFKSAGASVQSTTGSRGVRISGSTAGYTMSRGSVKGTGYPLYSPVSPSLPLSCVTVCHHISTGLYLHNGYTSTRYHSLISEKKKRMQHTEGEAGNIDGAARKRRIVFRTVRCFGVISKT